MKKNIHFISRMLTLLGALITIFGILMAVCGRVEIGGILWAAASCLFFAACHFRIAENKEEKIERMEDLNDEQETL